MDRGKESLIEDFLRIGVLIFEERTLKSGRVSPYFFNAGKADSVMKLSHLARGYAALVDKDTDVIFGPAYKGIPLALYVAAEFSKSRGRDVGWAFNRKETKAHGELGDLVGTEIRDGFIISLVDDVITDGATKYETVDFLRKNAKVEIPELIIAFNRQEVNDNGEDAAAQFQIKTGVEVKSSLSVGDLYDFTVRRDMVKEKDRLIHYAQFYGTPEFKEHIVENFKRPEE